MLELKDGIRSLVKIDFSGRVHKTFRGTNAKERFENEIMVLKTLEQRGCPYVPRVLESYPNEYYFVSTNCGKSAESFISQKKADTLFNELEEKYGVRHNDAETRNVTYDEGLGRFCLIDFELSELLPFDQAEDHHSNLIRLRWASLSTQGRRHLTNQDSMICLIKDEQRSHMASHGEIIFPTSSAFFCVSDGIGGNKGGEFASKLVVGKLRYELERQRGVMTKRAFQTIITETHQHLNQQAAENEHASTLGATFVSLLFQAGKILWGNAGDSRLYRLRDGILEQISKDHNFAFRQWMRGEISELEYRLHPRANILYEALGGSHNTVNPEIGVESWEPGDRYLLCSDGITDGLWDRKIKSYLGEDLSVEEITQKIHDEALSSAGDDDTSIIILVL